MATITKKIILYYSVLSDTKGPGDTILISIIFHSMSIALNLILNIPIYSQKL